MHTCKGTKCIPTPTNTSTCLQPTAWLCLHAHITCGLNPISSCDHRRSISATSAREAVCGAGARMPSPDDADEEDTNEGSPRNESFRRDERAALRPELFRPSRKDMDAVASILYPFRPFPVFTCDAGVWRILSRLMPRLEQSIPTAMMNLLLVLRI